MEFISTRGFSDSVSFTEAVSQGLAPDGGLYLPCQFPDLSRNFDRWENLAYDELCFEFFEVFTARPWIGAMSRGLNSGSGDLDEFTFPRSKGFDLMVGKILGIILGQIFPIGMGLCFNPAQRCRGYEGSANEY